MALPVCLGQVFTLLRLINMKFDFMVHAYFLFPQRFFRFIYGFQGFWAGHAPRFQENDPLHLG